MKLGALVNLNSINSNSKTEKQAIKSNNFNISATNAIANNSLQEALGRSQVSFCGTHEYKNGKFTYSQKTFGGPSENIKYDRTTGMMEYYEQLSNGGIKKIIRINPRTQEEFIEETDKDGYTTTTKISPKGTHVVEKDAKNNITFEERIIDDARACMDYDYRQHRIIVKCYEGDSDVPEIHVLDLSSKKEVDPKDPRVLDKKKVRTDEGDFEYRTIDLTTGDVYESRIMDSLGVVKGYERSFESGQLIWKAERRNNKLYENKFDEQGRATESIVTDLNNKSKIVETYNKKGEVISKEKSTYNRHGEIATIAEFNLDTNKIQYVTTFMKNRMLVDTYTPEGSPRLSTQEFDKNSILLRKIHYYPNGTTPKTIEEFSEVGFDKMPYAKKIVSRCNQSGQINSVEYYDANEFVFQVNYYKNGFDEPYATKLFNSENGRSTEISYNSKGKISERTIYDKNGRELSYIKYFGDSKTRDYSRKTNRDGSVFETRYSATGVPETSNVYSKYGDLIEHIKYFDDGQSIQFSLKYNKDGSFLSTTYSIDGVVLDSFEAYADGSPKPSKATFNETSSKFESEPSIDEVIKNIVNVIGSKNKSLNDVDAKQWVQFANYLGIKDVNKLFEMEKTIYRELAKKFHPDKGQYLSHEIMLIINDLYKN